MPKTAKITRECPREGRRRSILFRAGGQGRETKAVRPGCSLPEPLSNRNPRRAAQSPTNIQVDAQRHANQHEQKKAVRELQWVGGPGKSFDDFRNPIAFPDNKQQASNQDKNQPSIVTGFIDHNGPVIFSDPTAAFRIKVMMPFESHKFATRPLSPLPAPSSMPQRLGGEKNHQAQSDHPAKQNYDLQHRGVSEINASCLSLRRNVVLVHKGVPRLRLPMQVSSSETTAPNPAHPAPQSRSRSSDRASAPVC
jgi:hypothetical protein